MSTLTRTRLRLAGDAANFDAPLDVLRRATPQFWRGNDAQFELAVFFNGALQDVSNLASLTLEIRPLGSGGAAPDPGFTPLMGATVTSFDNTTTLDSWNSGTKQHAVVTFTAAQSNIVAGPAWLSIFVITTDSPGRVITLCAGPVRVLEDGSGLATTPSPAGDTFYTAAQSDARFAPIGGGGGGGGSGSVTSVALSVPSFLSVAGSPITSAGTLAVSLANANANLVFAGPGSGSAAAPGFRALVAADLPAIAQAGVTGLTSALAALAPLASPAFTGTPTAPTPGGSDNSTNLATTAWVRGYTAPVSNDGSGHYAFGGSTYYTMPDSTVATLTVNGPMAIEAATTEGSVNTFAVINTNTTNGGDVMFIQNKSANGNSSIDFMDNNSNIMGAIGYGNIGRSSGDGFFQTGNRIYISASPPFVAPYTSNPTSGVGELCLSQEGVVSSTYKERAGLLFDNHWAIIMQDYNKNNFFKIPGPADAYGMLGIQINPGAVGNADAGGAGSPAYISSNSPGVNGGAGSYISFNACDGSGTYTNSIALAALNPNYNYNGDFAGGGTLYADGAGLCIGATASSGVIRFATGGSNTTNQERLRIDASGNLIFSNHVTSAPSVTLASGQYQITVYDNGSAPVLRVRYNNGSTVKVGDLALS